MKSVVLSVVFLLTLVIQNVLSICPESGCGCKEHCVDSSNIWCKNDNDAECSCKKGCLVYDNLLEPEESKRVYCNRCNCGKRTLSAACTRMESCTPEDFVPGIDYPINMDNQNCDK